MYVTMASSLPSKPSATALRFARISGAIHPLAPHKTHRESANVTDEFIDSKKDRRLIKRSAFLSKVQKSHTQTNPNAISKSLRNARSKNNNKKKNKRLQNNLQVTLDTLEDALPDLGDTAEQLQQLRDGKIRLQSLESKPGLLKRKERIVKGELQRFGHILANVTAKSHAEPQQQSPKTTDLATGSEQQQVATAKKGASWAALRGFISSTMEKHPAFMEPNQT